MPASRYASGSKYAGSSYSGGGSKYAKSSSEGGGFVDNLQASLAANPTVQGAVGAGRILVDLISRPLYAVAGAAEEAVTPSKPGDYSVPARMGLRASKEILSGLPFTDIQGKKREFIQVMERAGVPELGHLHDLIPELPAMTPFGPKMIPTEGTPLDVTGRGAVGMAANIALDPTTWVTSGGSTAGRFATAKGVLNLNKEGLAVKDALVKEMGLTYKLLDEAPDATLREMGRRQVREVLENKVRSAVAADPSLLEKTGLKFAGMEVVSPRMVKNLTEPVKQMILSAPLGAKAATTAEAWGQKIRNVFDAFADVAPLDESAREGVKNKVREYQSAVAAQLHREGQVYANFEVEEAKLAKRYGRGDKGVQVLGKKFADWRQGTGTPNLTTEEADFFKRFGAHIDRQSDINVRNGVITGEQYDKYKGKFLHQDYKNKEDLIETMARDAVADGLLPAARVNKERQFETFADAVQVSRDLEREGKLARDRGEVRTMYRELIPEYGMTKNLWSHTEQSTRAIFQKKLFQDVAENYGAKIDEFYDPSRVYALHDPIPVPDKDRAVIEEFLGSKKTLKPLSEDRQAALEAAANGKPVDPHAGWGALTKDIRETLPALSKDGQKEFARQLSSMARDESHILRVREAVGDSLMPNVKPSRPGDINQFFLKHGLPEDKSKLVRRGGGVWGEQEHLIPQAIADLLDDAPRDLLKNKDTQKHLGMLVGGLDKIGNFFKGVTYPAYPSGAFRDLYNNVQNGFLALGVGSLTRPGLAAEIRAGTDSALEIGALSRTAKQWKTLSEDLRVVDPSASSFVQTTGKTGAEKAGLYAKARGLRGEVDNGTRTQIWVAGMRMGMTPEDSARMVHEFLYNYAELSPFDRDVMRRAMPFYVFPRKTISLYPKVIAKNPGRVANLNKLFQGRDSENNEMTSWEGEGFKIRLDKNGRDLTVLNGVDLPIRSFDMIWSGGWQKSLERVMGSAHPIPKVLYMMASGRDPFRGREMERMSSPTVGRWMKDAPRPIKHWIGWRPETDAAGRTTYTVNEEKVRVLLEASMLSRVFSTTDSYFRDQMQEKGAPNFWLKYFTGLQLKKLNLNEERRKNLAAKQKIAEDEAVKQGDAYRFESVSPRPKGTP